MRNIYFSEKAQARIDRYSSQYRSYYTELYSDSGIWAEEQIIDGYLREARNRKDELYGFLATKLSDDVVLGRLSDTSTILRWRSRYLFVSWEDDGDDRIITDLDIR